MRRNTRHKAVLRPARDHVISAKRWSHAERTFSNAKPATGGAVAIAAMNLEARIELELERILTIQQPRRRRHATGAHFQSMQ